MHCNAGTNIECNTCRIVHNASIMRTIAKCNVAIMLMLFHQMQQNDLQCTLNVWGTNHTPPECQSPW